MGEARWEGGLGRKFVMVAIERERREKSLDENLRNVQREMGW